MAKNTLKRFVDHPDIGEIVAKLVSDIPASDIAEWLAAKYENVGENKFILSEKLIKEFQEEYLDLYNKIRDDAGKLKFGGEIEASEDSLKELVESNPAYHEALQKYLDKEIDIKSIIRKMVVNIEHRASQVFDSIQEDPRNIKMDRTLVEWFNTLTNILEKYDTIVNGSPDTILQQNNINIQIVDQHIGAVYKVIKEILSKLDYDTSLLFIELFNKEMSNLKLDESKHLSLNERLEEAKNITASFDKNFK